jgi:hypothetical protein
MRLRTAVAITTCLLMTPLAFGQLADLDPDWKELDSKPPASFRTDNLVYVEMPRYVSVKVGIDPETLTVSSDGIVRYVVVAVSRSGNVNAAYEGIWCRAGEVKVYARAGNDKQWDVVQDPEWKELNANQPSMHARALARQGVCDGRSASGHSPQDIIRKLKQSVSDGVQR